MGKAANRAGRVLMPEIETVPEATPTIPPRKRLDIHDVPPQYYDPFGQQSARFGNSGTHASRLPWHQQMLGNEPQRKAAG